MQYCERCRKSTNVFRCSMFNTQMVCLSCIKAEKELPEYEEARRKEHEEVCKGNYNYEGIGYPR